MLGLHGGPVAQFSISHRNSWPRPGNLRRLWGVPPLHARGGVFGGADQRAFRSRSPHIPESGFLYLHRAGADFAGRLKKLKMGDGQWSGKDPQLFGWVLWYPDRPHQATGNLDHKRTVVSVSKSRPTTFKPGIGSTGLG